MEKKSIDSSFTIIFSDLLEWYIDEFQRCKLLKFNMKFLITEKKDLIKNCGIDFI
jgi:hypothetical protein